MEAGKYTNQVPGLISHHTWKTELKQHLPAVSVSDSGVKSGKQHVFIASPNQQQHPAAH